MRVGGWETLRSLRMSAGPAVLGFAALISTGVLAQSPTLKQRSPEQRAEELAASRRITLNIQATDAAGNPVTDLSQADFTVQDNHHLRKISAFHAIDGRAMNDAAQLVIVLDAVNSTQQELEAERDGIFKYLSQGHGPLLHPTAFVLWSNGRIKSTNATTDRNALGRVFVKWTKGLHSNACVSTDSSSAQKIAVANPAGPSGGAVDPAVCRAVHFKDSVAALDGIAQQQLTVGGRTLLVWIGPGWPVVNDGSAKSQQAFADEHVIIMHSLRAAQVTVHSLSAKGGNDEAEATNAAMHSPSGLDLRVLAEKTGGRVIAGSADIAADLRDLAADADWYYIVSFNGPPALGKSSEVHELEVKVNRPGIKVRTLTRYFAEP